MKKEWLGEIEAGLRKYLEGSQLEGELLAACEYSVFSGGKRFRPLLTLATAEACGNDYRVALAPACAVEFLHTFTLVQDDLPDLDNDEERRGQPTTHIKFGVSVALMASDALFGLAFHALATAPGPAETRARGVAVTARRIALPGVIGGQVQDLRSSWHRSRCTETADADSNAILDAIFEVNRMKTGSLMALAMELGAMFAGASDETIARLAKIGEHLGILFQVADDLEDPKDRQNLGRALGSVEALKRRADTLYEETLAMAQPFGEIPGFIRWAYLRDEPALRRPVTPAG
ncbi:MAG: polyprenyl synthetase family protein [bacterium JZ-2024 1]